MTSRPSFILRRLVVTKSDCAVYDEEFHEGINIIRSDDNSLGKSSIMNFIFYSLGGELVKWTTHQLRCDYVYIDLDIGSKKFCVRRGIVRNGNAASYVRDGHYQDATDGWLRFGIRRSEERQSFSQWMFNELGLPQYKTDSRANLTMHQILRLMYFDQVTPDNNIIRVENHDSEITRDSVGDFLLGLNNIEYARLKQECIGIGKQLAAKVGKLKSIFGFLGDKAPEFKEEIIANRIVELNEEIEGINSQIAGLSASEIDALDKGQQQIINALRNQISRVSDELDVAEKRVASLNMEIVDNDLFITSLQDRIKALEESSTTLDALDEVSFKYCPLCLASLKNEVDENQCPLCGHKSDEQQAAASGYLRHSTEIQFQLKESASIVEKQKTEKHLLEVQMPHLKKELTRLRSDYKSQTEHVTPHDAAVASLSKNIGYLEAKINAEEGNLELAARIERLTIEQGDLQAEFAKLKEQLISLEASNKERSEAIRTALADGTIELVKQDIGQESHFVDPDSFTFDFGKNTYAINSADKISESSAVILKSSFGLALFIESTKDDLMRFPRFMILDQIEGQGMVNSRRWNFQKLIVESCKDLTRPFQLIFTTSSLFPELEDSEYCVGPCYTKDRKTLNFSECD